MSYRAVQIRNRDAFSLPEVQELFTRAFKADTHADPEDAWAWCGASILNPELGVWVVRDDEMHLAGLGICSAVIDVWSPDPVCLHIYGEEREAVESLVAEIRAWGLSLGHGRIRGVNVSGRSDKRHLGIIGPYGTGTKIGSVCLWEFRRPEDDE